MNFDLIKSYGGEDLEKEWESLFKSLEISSFEELEELDKAFGFGRKKKDTSKLIPVKKEVTKNGRTYMTTVYVSPKEAETMDKQKKLDPEKQEKLKAKEEKKQQKLKAKEEKKQQKIKAKEEKAKAKIEKLKAKPNKTAKDHKKIFEAEILAPYDATIKELKANIEKWEIQGEAKKALQEATKDHYFITAKGEDGEVGAVGAFKRDKDRLVMPHFGSIKKLKGAGIRIVKKLVEKAGSMGLGAEVHPPAGAHNALINYGFKDELTGTLVMDSKTTKEKYEAISKKAEEKAPEKKADDSEGEPKKVEDQKPKETPEKAPEEKAPEKKESKEPKESKEKTHEKIKKELRTVRKTLGAEGYKNFLEFSNIKWERNEHAGIDTMRASMAAAKFIKEGGKLDITKFLKEEEEKNKNIEPAKTAIDEINNIAGGLSKEGKQ